MARALKSKICWSCDGTLSRDELQCPFCGTSQEFPEPRESLERIMPLPIDPLGNPLSATPLEKPKAPLLHLLSERGRLLFLLISTMLGSTLLLFSLLLFTCAEESKLVLVWHASYSPLLALLSALLLFASYKSSESL